LVRVLVRLGPVRAVGPGCAVAWGRAVGLVRAIAGCLAPVAVIRRVHRYLPCPCSARLTQRSTFSPLPEGFALSQPVSVRPPPSPAAGPAGSRPRVGRSPPAGGRAAASSASVPW